MKKIISVVLICTLATGGVLFYLFGGSGLIKQTNDSITFETYENTNYVDYVDTTDIIKNKSNIKSKYRNHYDKYITYTAPNGKKIYIVGGDKVSDEQLLKSYNVLSFYLEDKEGYDMKAVANSLADNNATICMPNGADGNSTAPMHAVKGQPVYQMEAPTEGDSWYIQNDYTHRDASYEEILHLVHDNGIGIKSKPGVLPELQKKIYDATMKALPKNKNDWGTKGIWGLNSKDWLLELEKEGSLEQEYLVSVVDSYYGLWAPYKENKGGMWGLYVAKDREEVKEKDPIGYAIVKDFLPENLTYMARINPEFTGTFKMYYDEKEPYTHKSKYLLNARLIENKDTNLLANKEDNILLGNSGNNIIDGKEGTDVVQFSGASSEYEITKKDGKTIVLDKENRDGEDTLINIEIFRFTDKDIKNNNNSI